MPREVSPAFQFYPADFIADQNVVVMTAEERGVYISLLCQCWIHGSIPNIPAEIQRLAQWHAHVCRQPLAEQWAKIWRRVGRCFTNSAANNRQLINPRIERERQKQAEYREMKRKAGLASAQQRSNSGSTQDQQRGNSSSSSSSSSSSTIPCIQDLGNSEVLLPTTRKNGSPLSQAEKDKTARLAAARAMDRPWQKEQRRARSRH